MLPALALALVALETFFPTIIAFTPASPEVPVSPPLVDLPGGFSKPPKGDFGGEFDLAAAEDPEAADGAADGAAAEDPEAPGAFSLRRLWGGVVPLRGVPGSE